MNAPAPSQSFVDSIDMGELIRDAAVSNRSAVLQPRALTGVGQRENEVVRFTKLKEYRRETRPAETAIVAVRRLQRYGKGWDGYEADPAVADSIRDAVEFLSRTASNAIFRADLGSDGIVSLAVDKGEARILLTFEGNGQVFVSEKRQGFWSEIGAYSIRGGLGRTTPAIEQLVDQS